VICLLAMCLCFVLCEHVASVLVFCVPCALMSICLDPTHLVTCLLINFPQLLSLGTLLICSLYNLLVFAVPRGFVAICRFIVRTACVQSSLVQSVTLRGSFCLFVCLFVYFILFLCKINPFFSSCNWVLALIHYRYLTIS